MVGLPISLVRHLKVLLKLFQKLAVSKGRAFGRSPQRAKSFILHKAQEGRKTFQRNVFRREPSQGVPCGCRPTAKTRNRSASLARSERRKIVAAVEVITNELPFGRTQLAPTINFYLSLLSSNSC